MKPTVPTPAEAIRLVFKRACESISREYGWLAQSIDAPSEKAAAVAFVKARRKAAKPGKP
jgi:hypothetical protein